MPRLCDARRLAPVSIVRPHTAIHDACGRAQGAVEIHPHPQMFTSQKQVETRTRMLWGRRPQNLGAACVHFPEPYLYVANNCPQRNNPKRRALTKSFFSPCRLQYSGGQPPPTGEHNTSHTTPRGSPQATIPAGGDVVVDTGTRPQAGSDKEMALAGIPVQACAPCPRAI